MGAQSQRKLQGTQRRIVFWRHTDVSGTSACHSRGSSRGSWHSQRAEGWLRLADTSSSVSDIVSLTSPPGVSALMEHKMKVE